MNELRSDWVNGERLQSISAGTRAFMVGVAVLSLTIANLALDRDGFAAEHLIQMAPAPDRFAFVLESRSPSLHDTTLTIEGLRPGRYTATLGTFVRTFRAAEKGSTRIQLPVRPGQLNPLRLESVAEH